METLKNVDEFIPLKAEMKKLADEYKNLEIKDEKDKEGYKLVVEAEKKLKERRIFISKEGENLRKGYTKTAKSIKSLADDIISIIEPVEEILRKKRFLIDNLEFLPERKSSLKDLGKEIEDSVLLKMTNVEFKNFYNKEKEIYLDLKLKEQKENEENELREKTEKIEKLHNERYSILIENNLFNFLENKYQKFGELKEEEFNLILENCKKNKVNFEETEKTRLENLKKETEEKTRKEFEEKKKLEEQRKETEEKEILNKIELEKKQKENEEKLAKERSEKNKIFLDWKKENNFDQNLHEVKRLSETEFEIWTIPVKISSISIKL